jgi:hypothetical protein
MKSRSRIMLAGHQGAAMFDPRHTQQQQFLNAKQASEAEYASLQKDAARRAQVAQLRGRRTTLRKRIRNWYRALIG